MFRLVLVLALVTVLVVLGSLVRVLSVIRATDDVGVKRGRHHQRIV